MAHSDNPKNSEVDAYSYIRDQLENLGWNIKNPARVPDGEVYEVVALALVNMIFRGDRRNNMSEGNCFFTCDETKIIKDKIYLIEAKNTTSGNLPSLSDIKDGLIKMNLYCNLHKVSINGKIYLTVPVLKLTASNGFKESELNDKELKMIDILKKESQTNGFLVELR